MATAWIHCNKCFTRFQPNIKFFLTECGHLNCQMCAKKMEENEKKCLICGYTCVSILLSNDLKPDVQTFFSNPLEAIDKIKNVVRFQQTNYTNLLKNILGKYVYAKNELAKFYKQNKELKKENMMLRQMLKSSNCNSSIPAVHRPTFTSTQIPGTFSPAMGSQISSVRSKGSLFITPQNRPLMSHPGMAQHSLTATPASSVQSPEQFVPASLRLKNSMQTNSSNSAMSSFHKLARHAPVFRR